MTQAHIQPFRYEHEFAEYLTALERGEKCLIDAAMFDYFLEVLPPVSMNTECTLIDGHKVRASFCFAEGAERIVAFWREGDNYFAQQTNRISRGW